MSIVKISSPQTRSSVSKNGLFIHKCTNPPVHHEIFNFSAESPDCQAVVKILIMSIFDKILKMPAILPFGSFVE